MTSDHEPQALAAPGSTPGAATRAESTRRAALPRTLALAASLVATSTIVAITRFPTMDRAIHARLSWWTLAIGFALAEVLVFHIEVRREAVTFSLSEIPLTLGLLLASPLSLVVGRVVGEAALLALYERQPLRKLLVNVATFFAECTVALVVFHAVPGDRDLARPSSWLAATLAVAAADGVGLGAITLAMRWHGAPVDPAKLIFTNAVTVITNTSLALLVAIVVDTNPSAALLFVVLALILVAAYRGYSALSRRYSSLQLLYEFTRLVSGSKEPDVVLAAMLSEAKRLLRAESAAIVIDDDDRTVSWWVGPESDLIQTRALPIRALRALVSGGRAAVLAANTRDAAQRAILHELGVEDCIVAPLVEGTDQVGVLLVAGRETAVSTFDTEDGRIFETLTNHASVALENGRLIDRLHEQSRQHEHDALHDSLTDLPNRSNFFQQLTTAIARARQSGAPLGVALLDLDHFKEVNDTLGHHHGDLLLREVASRLRAILPPSTTLARLGGDEFALLHVEDATYDGLLAVGRLVQDSFTHPFVVEHLELEVGASIGFACYPGHGDEPATLLQRADVAMYDAKASAGEHLGVYDPGRDVNSPRRLALATDLRLAIEARDLVLHFQPKARLSDGVVHGVEGLVRWRHPVFGNVPPDEFVPLAERTGLIHPFTDLVVAYGLGQARTWKQLGCHLGVSLNLSMRNLLDPALPGRIDRTLQETTVDPGTVTFEVTETTMMAEPAKVLRVLHDLADLGVRLSIDDFGTGHSSLAYLQQLPVHEVKIDKSFVFPLTAERGARAIVQSIIHLAHNLELNVVAEGVEDEATWDELRRLGCDDAQGYFLSRPIPAADLDAWLAVKEASRATV